TRTIDLIFSHAFLIFFSGENGFSLNKVQRLLPLRTLRTLRETRTIDLIFPHAFLIFLSGENGFSLSKVQRLLPLRETTALKI
ncbi:MAG: hypothetical protein U9R69_08840, partial [Thermodesulfobacteriota bacterium]|nr:hypothetical protein [Thermodesulfobacteriota bacterium]